jgi:hypothetical protein
MPATARVNLTLSVSDTALVVEALRSHRVALMRERADTPVVQRTNRENLRARIERARVLADEIEA